MRRAGRRFVNDAGIFRPRFVSAFRLPSRLMQGEQAHVEAFLDWAAETGFNGLRVMCGGGWLQASWSDGRTLPAVAKLLQLAKARGLYAELSAFCNTGIDPVPDKAGTIQAVAVVCQQAGNALLELANEQGHPTQDSEIHDISFLEGLYRQAKGVAPSLLVALGAADIDELDAPGGKYPTAGGDYCTVHLDRGRPLDQQISRLRELEMISETHGKPVMSNEPLGADEVLSHKQRYIDPDFAFVHGVYCRLAELGAVHHAEHGLQADLPGPNQQRCADAFIEGASIADDMGELTFKNARAGGSPVAEANFRVVAGGANNPSGTVWRVPAGVDGNRGIVPAIGLVGNRDPGIQWQGGWRPVNLRADKPMVKAWEVQR